MTRRLSEMAEEAMLEGGRSARKNMQQAGFSEDLKKQLEERIAASSFQSEYPAAHAIVDMPKSAGQGSRDIAAAAPWTGTESIHDSSLRMLDDSAPKPMRVPFKPPQPGPVDFRLSPKPKMSPGLRIASAKERTATYKMSEDPGLSDKEREAFRKEMRERFTSVARPMPVTVQGFASLANERIEDAMARGQFEKIKRGRGINTATDHNANSAFIDTTEYFMNKIIQKQEIVPPWIEKQQELVKDVDRFRQRLRTEWRRHAARSIASQGGSLLDQMKRADAHAAAEVRLVNKSKMEESLRNNEEGGSSTSSESNTSASESKDTGHLPHLPPFRDPNYLSTQRSFHELAIKDLNARTRSYNLQAPPVAQKPYLNLDRELSACFASVAPGLAEEIKRRATERAHPTSTASARPSGPFSGSLSTAQTSRVYDEDQAKGYGFKEFWQDLFSKK
ncbi:hypothetical protein ASPWEDRAFT_169404 [Aspergillus wentii DTO 134E9]|uniref:DnaJ homologue subfamily C member 28 conserved domain-containing protein n=1 Tax=Aspergillus wentii DTO 134E9 TaxID=1073089 RepID=A0A1L9RXA8_ASPWE|nr:uncharacterized protein ASPWEDRAFT_169404 [Aspergillus wentii DTO 134E9]OJJ39566.1 hypothetical protein ASPWEDRAFT_169404 [Aspergillus wentii DTO 134E9]